MVTVRVLRTFLVFGDPDEEVDSAKRTRSVPPDCREALTSASASNPGATSSHPAVADPEEKGSMRGPAVSSSEGVVSRFREELRLVEAERGHLLEDGVCSAASVAASSAPETEEVAPASRVPPALLQASHRRPPLQHVEGNTVMIRNISCHLKKEDIHRILADASLAYMYNDMHLPGDFGNSKNRGYFFLKFRSAEGVQRCIAVLHGKSFGNRAGDKRVEVVPADIQGNRKKFLRKSSKSRKTTNTAS